MVFCQTILRLSDGKSTALFVIFVAEYICKMKKENAIKIFEQKQVRTHWKEEQEKWYFAIVDVVAALTDSPNPHCIGVY